MRIIRQVTVEEHIGASTGFAPILRPRVVERIATAAEHRIVLIVAPAGYGKSVALSQYLRTVEEPKAHYQVHVSSLFAFVAGLAGALVDLAPKASQTVRTACEMSCFSKTPGLDLASWMQEHLRGLQATIAIDDLHAAGADPEIAGFLRALIDRSKEHLTWIVASRSLPDLPVASWIAYGDMDFQIDDRDLRFTIDEARQAARAKGAKVDEAQLGELVALTDGWPTALSVALRSSIRSSDLHQVAATTRETIYRYLAEQVYATLRDDERDLLRLTCFLPEIDVNVLKHAGYPASQSIIEGLRDRTAFVYAHQPGVYHCHDLFRDFLQDRVHLDGDEAVRDAKCRAAQALERAGQVAGALSLFADAQAHDQTLRVLESCGMQLFDQAHVGELRLAIDTLPETVCSGHTLIAGLQALIVFQDGNYDKAEELLEQAIALCESAELKATLAIRLALIRLNLRRDSISVLEAVEIDGLPAELRAEVASLQAAAYAHAEPQRAQDALACIESAQSAAKDVENDVIRAKVLHRIAGAGKALEMPRQRVDFWLAQAAALSMTTDMYSLAARAYGSLALTAFLYAEDFVECVERATQAVNVARSVGDRLAVQTGLIQLMDVERMRGNADRIRVLDGQLAKPAPRSVPSLAFVAAWNGDFAQAHVLLASAIGTMIYTWQRMYFSAVCALLLVADGRRAEGLAMLETVEGYADRTTTFAHAKREMARARILCAATQALAGRTTPAWQLLRDVNVDDVPTKRLHETVAAFCRATANPALRDEVFAGIESLSAAGHGGLSRLLESVFSQRVSQQAQRGGTLTDAELCVLRAIGNGQSPKSIAAQTGRSIHTVRTLYQRAAEKLSCSGQQAIIEAKRRGLL